MKMRKRIAALIAVAMIASLMPMTAFATSANRVTKVVTAKEGNTLDKDTAPELVIKVNKGDSITTSEAFYLKLENAEWDAGIDALSNDKVTLKKNNKTTLQVNVGKDFKFNTDVEGDRTLNIRMFAKLTGGEASVTIDSNDTVITAGKYVFAKSGDSKAEAKVGDVPTFVDEVEIAEITYDEAYVGAFRNKDPKNIALELEDNDFEFVKNADGNYGKLVGEKSYLNKVEISGVYDKDDKQTLTFTIPKDLTETQRGSLKFTGITIKAKKDAAEGDVELFVNADDFFEKETLVVAKRGDYVTELKVTDKVEEFTAGREETLEFTLKEVAATAINRDRSVTFTLTEDIEITKVEVDGIENTEFNEDENEFEVSQFEVKEADKDKAIKAEFKVTVKIPANFEGDIDVVAEGRAIEEKKEIKLAEVTAPVTVKVTPMKVEVGQMSNKGGKITITETAKGMLKRGKDIVIQLPADLKDDVTFVDVDELEIKTTGGIRVKDAELKDNAILINVTRQSSEAGSIEISGFELKSRRTIIDGAYEIEIGGDAISDNTTPAKPATDTEKAVKADIDAIATADFILVGDQLTKAEVAFTIGSDKFLVDGKEMTMDAAAYIKDGRTMVPLRYLSVALNIDEDAIKFASGKVTIIDGARIIQVTNGDKNLVVNGMSLEMAAAAEIKEGRTYVPITEIGSLFGVAGHWDAATQTATFK